MATTSFADVQPDPALWERSHLLLSLRRPDDFHQSHGTGRFQLCLRVGETDLEGEWRSDRPPQFRYQIVERHHEMRHEWWGGCSRHNELYLQVFDLEGELLERPAGGGEPRDDDVHPVFGGQCSRRGAGRGGKIMEVPVYEAEESPCRAYVIQRRTKETRISVDLCLEGGEIRISTGIGFFDHMLTAFAFYGGLGLKIDGRGRPGGGRPPHGGGHGHRPWPGL